MKTEQKNLKKYIGSIFIHTPKAIRYGMPNYTMYLAIGVEKSEEHNGEFLIAWEVDKENDLFNHVAFPILFSEKELEIAKDLLFSVEPHPETSRNNLSEFYPDSFYRKVTLKEALRILKNKPEKKVYNLYNSCTRITEQELLFTLAHDYQLKFGPTRYKKDPHKIRSARNISCFRLTKNKKDIYEVCRIDTTGQSHLIIEIGCESEAGAFIAEISKMCNVKYEIRLLKNEKVTSTV